MSNRELMHGYLAHVEKEAEAEVGREAVERGLAALWEEGRAAWPDIALHPAAFGRFVAERHSPQALAGEHVRASGPDLYLVCACVEGAAGAVAAFDRAHLSRAASYLSRLRRPPEFIDDVVQTVREKLFVAGAGKRPAIADFSGRGRLANWVATVVANAAYNLLRREGKDRTLDPHIEPVPIVGGEPDPVRELAQEKYRAIFAESIKKAFAALDIEQRNLLRLYYRTRLTTAKIAEMIDVNQATVVRRIWRANDEVRETTYRLFREALGASDATGGSIAADLISKLELGLTTLLGDNKERDVDSRKK